VPADHVTRRDRGGRGSTRETTRDGSRRFAASKALLRGASPLAIGVSAAGLVAAVLLVVTEFSTVASVDVASGSCQVINDANPDLADRCELSGFERHGGSFVLLGILAAAMAWGAGIGASRPAAIALVALGLLVLGWSLGFDLPESDEEGLLRDYEGARGSAGPGLTIELVAGGLALAAGAVRLLAPARE
jgi:hypothetical protein